MIQFEHKEFFWAYALLLFFVLIYWLYKGWKKRAGRQFGEKSLVDRLVKHRSEVRPALRFLLVLLALFFLITGIIDPKVGSKVETVKRKGIDLYIALDVSNSMLAEDIKPNRLSRAKMAISHLIDKLDGDRVGLIVFAGRAYKLLPLTTDYSAAKLFLSSVDTKIVPVQGTAIGSAIDMAASSFEKDKHNKAIIVITDGENHQDNPVQAAKKAADRGIKVFTIGMGLPDGAPIPIFDAQGNRSFLTDRKGKVVITKLDEQMLQEIAHAGNGTYARANNASVGLSKVLKNLNKIQKQELASKQFTDYEHHFQLFLAIAFFFLVIELLLVERQSKWTEKIDFFGK
jgi:Ca-activated chloride channel family protein